MPAVTSARFAFAFPFTNWREIVKSPRHDVKVTASIGGIPLTNRVKMIPGSILD